MHLSLISLKINDQDKEEMNCKFLTSKLKWSATRGREGGGTEKGIYLDPPEGGHD